MLTEAVTSLLRPSPATVYPDCSVYLNRPISTMKPYLGRAILFLALGLTFSYGSTWTRYIGFTIAGYAAPVYLLLWILRNDRYEKEPFALVAYCFGWGAFCGVAAGVINAFVTTPYLGAGGAGIVEEPLKAIGIFLIARNYRLKNEFNDHLDGIVYGAAAGAGFAGLENFWYLYEMIVNGQVPPLLAVFVRSVTAFMHIAWTAQTGRSLGLAKAIKGSVVLRDLLPGLTVAAALHGVWNTAPLYVSFLLLLPFVARALRLQLRTAQLDEQQWGFASHAPNETE